MRLAATRRDELGDLVALYNEMGDALRAERHDIYQRELLLDTVLQGAPVGISWTDRNGRVVYANRAARDLLGARAPPGGPALAERARRAAAASCARRWPRPATRCSRSACEGEEETYRTARRAFHLNMQPQRAAPRRAPHARAAAAGGRGLEAGHPRDEPRAQQLARAHPLARRTPRARRPGGRSTRRCWRGSSPRSRSGRPTWRRSSRATPASRACPQPRPRDGGLAASSWRASTAMSPVPARRSAARRSPAWFDPVADAAGAHQPAQERAGVGQPAGRDRRLGPPYRPGRERAAGGGPRPRDGRRP